MYRISGADFPVAHTMKMRPNFCSYSRLPPVRAILTSSPTFPAFSCSCTDQAEDCSTKEPCLPDSGLLDSPIRGWPRKASIQSDSVRSRQISSEAAAKEVSSLNGRRAAILRAQAWEPQQGRICVAAASRLVLFQRARTSLAAFCSSARSVLRNSATRLAATAARYFAVDRMSSIGWISADAVFLANFITDSSMPLPITIRSVSLRRSGIGATLPTAMRTSSTNFPLTRPSAAMQTFEIACALRLPTFRARETYPENFRGRQ